MQLHYTVSSVLLAALTAAILIAMWWAWRRRTREGDKFAQTATPDNATRLASYPRVLYIATTDESHQLERVNVPGLRYRGYATVTVYVEGVTIHVTGEPPVHIRADQVLSSGTAQFTIDKVVERDGLATLEWEAHKQRLASTFRFGSTTQHQDFARNIAHMLHVPHP